MPGIDRASQDQSMARREARSTMEALEAIMRFHRGETIYDQGDPAEYWYCVASGLARKCALMPEGRRRIVDFLLPGEFFGFSAGDEHAFAVEAVVEGTTVARYPRGRIERLADGDPQLRRLIRELVFQAISRVQARILILGRTTAREKVGYFLVEIERRLSEETAETVVLPMSRYDIADYLALSVETVSRSLTDLKHRGAIALLGKRRVRIVDRSTLANGCGNMG
jgi:CRP/FNR family nitrogen fixation transcriptional regulator